MIQSRHTRVINEFHESVKEALQLGSADVHELPRQEGSDSAGDARAHYHHFFQIKGKYEGQTKIIIHYCIPSPNFRRAYRDTSKAWGSYREPQ